MLSLLKFFVKTLIPGTPEREVLMMPYREIRKAYKESMGYIQWKTAKVLENYGWFDEVFRGAERKKCARIPDHKDTVIIVLEKL